MRLKCTHVSEIRDVTPSAKGCEECLKTGDWWVHLRLCRICGHVGCCDDSPNKHARAHFEASGHPIIEGYDPPEGGGWCYIDDSVVKLDHRTPQLWPIKRGIEQTQKGIPVLLEFITKKETVISRYLPGS